MSFTDRQLHALNVIGLVAWTCKHSTVPPDQSAVQIPAEKVRSESSPAAPDISCDQTQVVGDVTSQAVTADNSAEASTQSFDDLSTSLEVTAQWLVTQELLKMPYRGANVTCIGPSQASLLVVCSQAESAMQSPLSAQCSQLFDLMMRSIEIRVPDVKLCAVATWRAAASRSGSASAYLEDVQLPQTRAVLILDSREYAFTDVDVTDKVRLPGSSLPLWRVPHPDLLLAKPALKRYAWESLKGLKRVLDSSARL